MQFFYPAISENEIILVYSFGNASTFFAYLVFGELFEEKVRYKSVFSVILSTFIITILLFQTDLNFSVKALPFAFSLSFPLFFIVKGIFFKPKRKTTLLEKFLGLIFILWIIHAFNFAFFRMMPDAPMYGWVTTYVLFDLLGIILPAITIERFSATEQERLHNLVDDKTKKLSQALNEKELLLKILVHDISNPLTIMKWYLQYAKKEQKYNPVTFEKIIHSQQLVEELVNSVRLLQVNPDNKNIKKISISKSIEEVEFIFSKQLGEKNISIKVIDHTLGDDFIYADHSSFNNNILSNFTSNAIKFSPPNSQIIYQISKDNNYLELCITDNGPGIDKEILNKILRSERVTSTEGTTGEKGSGIGLSIAKSVLESMNAVLSIENTGSGTKVNIRFSLK